MVPPPRKRINIHFACKYMNKYAIIKEKIVYLQY
nr:MAG TPA: hypothetical protein [Caudoviricetes sp.]